MGASFGTVLALSTALQVSGATVSGAVTDADTGEPLAAATVVLVEEGGGVLSEDDGRYLLSTVPAGPHHLAISRLGYATRTVHALVPASGVLVLDVALRSEPIRLEGLSVEPPPLMVGNDRGSGWIEADRTLSLAAIRTHPLLAEPDALRALTEGATVVMDPEAPFGLHVHGGDAGHTGYSLDGIPVLDPVHAGSMFSAWNPDALDGVALTASVPSSSLPAALSGVVTGVVRSPGERLAVETSLTTSHAAITARGPLGDAGYVLSLRSGFPGLPWPSGDPSYLRGEAGDALAKVRFPALGGEFETLYYSSENELVLGRLDDPASGSTAGGGPLEWKAESLGLTWSVEGRSSGLELKAWRATSGVGATWMDPTTQLTLEAGRRDLGAQATARFRGDRTIRELGARLWRVATAYHVSHPGAPLRESAAPVVALFGEQATDLTASLRVRVGGALESTGGALYAPLHVQIAWSPSEHWAWKASLARSYQFTQSLANAESVARHVFPADLSIVAGTAGVPVPSSDKLVVGVEWRPSPGVRIGAEAYARAMANLLLVAPAEAGPFASDSTAVGSGQARGLSVTAAGVGARTAWLVGYGWQRVTRSHAATYQPVYGPTHLASAGLTVHPSATWSVRLSFNGALGRQATEVVGPFEWEACNLRDMGCEFAGAPRIGGDLGGTPLPGYLRADVGVRKHWHLTIGGRGTVLGMFGTVTNIFGRHNVFNYVRDGTGTLTAADMQPTGPLLVGLDWRF